MDRDADQKVDRGRDRNPERRTADEVERQVRPDIHPVDGDHNRQDYCAICHGRGRYASTMIVIAHATAAWPDG